MKNKAHNLTAYASGYELLAYKLLDQLSRVQRYQRPPDQIRYQRPDGSWHQYHPDILVEYTDGGAPDLIEVKMSWQLVHPAHKPIIDAKFTAARRWCTDHGIQFCVWTEEDLKVA